MAVDPQSSNAPREQRNARYGLILFAVYLALYAGFMAVSTLSPRAMAAPVLLGINLAIVYGFGLIIAALVLALIYMALCGRPMPSAGAPEDKP